MEPQNKHGDRRNISVSDFKDSSTKTAVAPGSVSAAMRNARQTLKVAARRRK